MGDPTRELHERIDRERQEMRDAMPALAARVFALRNASYYGCGFHYAMEARLGKLLAALNNFDTDIENAIHIIHKVSFRSLVADIRKAEATADYTTPAHKQFAPVH